MIGHRAWVRGGMPHMLWTLSLVLIAIPVLAVEKLVLVAPQNTVDTVISEVILHRAYRRIGIEVLIRKYPAERALQLANQGEVDGDVQRIDGISAQYPDLLQVVPAINFIEGALFTRDIEFDVQGWASLRPFQIGIIRGIKFAELNTQGMNVQRASDYQHLFEMLSQGRFDIIVSTALNGEYHLRRLHIQDVRRLDPAIMRFDLFHYLHRKHAELVPRISATLESMQASGDLERMRNHIVQVLLERAAEGLPECDDDYACFQD